MRLLGAFWPNTEEGTIAGNTNEPEAPARATFKNCLRDGRRILFIFYKEMFAVGVVWRNRRISLFGITHHPEQTSEDVAGEPGI